jgi:hypothetical protein
MKERVKWLFVFGDEYFGIFTRVTYLWIPHLHEIDAYNMFDHIIKYHVNMKFFTLFELIIEK